MREYNFCRDKESIYFVVFYFSNGNDYLTNGLSQVSFGRCKYYLIYVINASKS